MTIPTLLCYVPKLYKCYPACPRFQEWGYWLVGGNFQQGRETPKGRCYVQMRKIEMHFLLLYNNNDSWANLCADQCSRTMQQCEHRIAVRDGPSVSDSGLRCTVISGPQCGRLVPLTSHLPSKPFSTGHKHARPVPGKRTTARSGQQSDMSVSSDVFNFIFSALFLTRWGPLYRDDCQPIWPSKPFPALPDNLFVGERESRTFRFTE